MSNQSVLCLRVQSKDVGCFSTGFPVALRFNPAAALHLKTKSASIFHSLFDLGIYDNETLTTETSIQRILTEFSSAS